jgi:nucleotide-binding universal stress UspA family protein
VKRILVYLDGSEESVTAAQYAVVLCRLLHGELTALYVVNVRALEELVNSKIFITTEREEYARDLEKDAERYLNHVKNLALQKGVVVRAVKRLGTPYLEIKSEVTAWDADLLVLGESSAACSQYDEYFNETERALRNVHCSVLVVKDEERVWKMYETLV